MIKYNDNRATIMVFEGSDDHLEQRRTLKEDGWVHQGQTWFADGYVHEYYFKPVNMEV